MAETDEYDCPSDSDYEAQSPFVAESSSDTKFQIISFDEFRKEVDLICDETAVVLGIPSKCCKVLLNIFHWDKNKLLEEFYEAESAEAFFQKHKIQLSTEASKVSLPSKVDVCYICFDSKLITGFYCGHFFCYECLNSYLSTRFREENEAFPKCATPDCLMLATDDVVLKILSDEKEKDFYRKLVIKTIVDSNPYLKWCPGNDCNNIAQCKTTNPQTIKCQCGTYFCFSCTSDSHDPLPCSYLKKWIKKCEGDSLTMKWVSCNTKDCPKCNVPIEKNGGCNRMHCRNNNCGYQFCWSCMQDWNVHGYNQGCNRYEPKNEEIEHSRTALQRYMHYYDRFMNHKKSLKAEDKLIEQINTKVTQMQTEACYSWIETQFLMKALEALQNCRRILMYTYPFAFYLPSSNAKSIFEDNQSDLEHATEELSGLLEQEMNLEKDDILTLKQKVQDKSDYCNKRREVMLRHCAEGIERGEWVFLSIE